MPLLGVVHDHMVALLAHERGDIDCSTILLRVVRAPRRLDLRRISLTSPPCR